MADGGRGAIRESAREMVVVVASILIAFTLDAWWQSRVEHREERDLIANLLEEFSANLEQLDTRIENHRRLAAASGALSDLVSRAPGATVMVPDSLLYSLFITPTFDPTLGTFEEAQSSGRTELIRSPELRALLGAWPGMWRDAREEEVLGQELVQLELYPAVARTVRLDDLMSRAGAWLAGPAMADSGSARAVPATPGLANFARQRWARNRRAVLELTDLRTQLGRIVDALREVGDAR